MTPQEELEHIKKTLERMKTQQPGNWLGRWARNVKNKELTLKMELLISQIENEKKGGNNI